MLLFQILLLRLAGVIATHMLVKEGQEVTLPCPAAQSGVGVRCNWITWTFSDITKSAAKEVVSLGKLKQEGLGLATDCSLVIKNVTTLNAGNYECLQYQLEPGSLDKHEQVGMSRLDLNVVKVEERRDKTKVKFTCSVFSFGRCGYKLKWDLGIVRLDKHNRQIKEEVKSCSNSISIPHFHFLSSSDHWTCNITDVETGKVTIFRTSVTQATTPYRKTSSTTTTTTTITTESESIPEKTSRETSKGTPELTSEAQDTSTRLSDLWWLFLPVGLVGFCVVVLLFVRWRRNKGGAIPEEPSATGTNGGTGEQMVHTEEEVSYSSISYTGKKRREPPVQGRDSDDTVTYSTVKKTSCPADPNMLYSTINFKT